MTLYRTCKTGLDGALPRQRGIRRPLRTGGPAGILPEPLEGRRLLSRVIYVDWEDHNGNADNDGANWQSAYLDLRVALAAASSGDEIRVAGGTYRPTTDADRTISFELKDGVRLYGGYAGQRGANPDVRDTTAHATILSGDIGTPGSPLDNSYRVVTGVSVGGTTLLDGFTITAGRADGASPYREGGGLHLRMASPQIQNCTFSGNMAMDGGGIYNFRSSPTIINCAFIGNTADRGGGLHNHNNSSPMVLGSVFAGNSASLGGAAYAFSSAPTFSGSTFTSNTATSGGALYHSSATPGIMGCAFFNNLASEGGAIFNTSSPTSLSGSTFIRNSASLYGGAIANSNSGGTIAGCMFAGNSAASYGGGISNAASSPTISDTVFSGNTSNNGGGIYNNAASPTLLNCTLSGNAALFGGALSNSNASAPSVVNSIVWGNGVNAIHNQSSAPTIHHSLVDGGYAGEGNINANPHFVRNPSPGPDGVWGTAEDDYGDLRLRLNSPAIDAGDNDFAAASDLAGRPRSLQVHGDSPIADMGAYETLPPITLAGTGSLYLRLNADQRSLEVWNGSAPIGSPAHIHHYSDLTVSTFVAGSGARTLFLDFANGNPIQAGLVLAGDPADDVITLADDDNRAARLAALRSMLASGRMTSTHADSMHGLSTTFTPAGHIALKLALYGDLNDDGAIDGDDYFIMDRAFLMGGEADPQADINHDARVDAADYVVMDRVFLQFKAQTAPAATAAAQQNVERRDELGDWLAESGRIL